MNKTDKKFLLALFVFFLVSMASTLAAWKITQDVVKTEIRQNFNQEVLVIKHWMQDRLNLYLPIALGIKIFFESGDEVSANEWSRYVQRLELIDKYPAISSISYVERVRNEDRDAYLVKYVESLNENKEIIGFDLSSDQKQLELLNSVRDEDPTSTGRVVLIPTPKKGFEIILPVYREGPLPTTVEDRRETLKGFILVEFEGSRLFQDIINAVDSTNLSFEVYSGLPNEENLLYDHGFDYLASDPDYRPEITVSDTFVFNSQTWHLTASARPDFKLSPSQNRLPLIVLGGGLVLSLAIFGLFLHRLLKYRSFVRG